MNIIFILTVVSLTAVGFAERPPSMDRELFLPTGYLSVRQPASWELLEQSGGESVAYVAFREGSTNISLRSYLLSYLPDRNASPFYQQLTAARYGEAAKSQFKSESGQKWEVFTRSRRQAAETIVVVDYYATVQNARSHTCGIHVRLAFPSSTESEARTLIAQQLRRFLSSVFIDSKS